MYYNVKTHTHTYMHAYIYIHTYTPEREKERERGDYFLCRGRCFSLFATSELWTFPQADFTSPRAPLRSVHPEDSTEHAQDQRQLQKDQEIEVDADHHEPGEGSGLRLSIVGDALSG